MTSVPFKNNKSTFALASVKATLASFCPSATSQSLRATTGSPIPSIQLQLRFQSRHSLLVHYAMLFHDADWLFCIRL